MPLPSYTPRSDSFGNWYFGGFQVDSAVEAGYGAATSLTATQAEFNTFLDAALGSGNWAVSGTNYYFRFNNAYEQLTGAVTTSANYRFKLINGGNQPWMNTAPTGTPVDMFVNNNFSIATLWNAANCGYAVANQYGLWFVNGAKGTPGILTTAVQSAYLGWVKDPVFPVNTTERVRNLIMGPGTDSASNAFACTGAASSTSAKHECFANSVITCDVATPGANITDLCFVDSDQSYLNIGSAYNALFYSGTGLTIGRIYRIPPDQDPDGNTGQNIWLCAERVYGWNGSAGVASAGYKLIRVWSNNIT